MPLFFCCLNLLICPPRSLEQLGWDAAAPPPRCRAVLSPRDTGAGQGFHSSLVAPVQGLRIEGLSPSRRRRIPEASGCPAAGDGGRGKAKVRDSALRFPLLILHKFRLPFYGLKLGYSQSMPPVVFRCSRVIMTCRHKDGALFEVILLLLVLTLG